MESRDLIVIGGGPGGYSAAIRAAQLGAKVALIEKSNPGGVCVSRGCIPMRALARAAELLDVGKAAREYGITFGDPTVDFSRLMGRKDTVVKTVSSGVRLLLEGNGVEVVNGTGQFAAPGVVEATLNAGGVTRFSGKAVIIASGSRCEVPSNLSGLGNKLITTDDVFSLNSAPSSLVILGAGFVGLALATFFSRIGSRVTVVEESTVLLPHIDGEVVAILDKEIRRAKVEVILGGNVEVAGSNVKVNLRDGRIANIDADMVLVTERRRPNVDVGLDKAGVGLDNDGGIKVNHAMETNVPGVYAVGDVTNKHMFTAVAYAEGIVAAQNAMKLHAKVDYAVVPICANTIPEVAAFGLTEAEALARGYEVGIGRFPFAANAVATTLGQRTGLVKIVTDKKYGQILGAHIVGPQAASLLAEMTLAAKLEATAADIAGLMHFHPSLSEAVWESARDSLGQAIHWMSQDH